jgi:amidohydrolase
MKKILPILSVLFFSNASAQKTNYDAAVLTATNNIEQKVIDWRRDFHANPELGNRETRTADIVAKHLRSLNIEVTTGVAKTGVIGILKGGFPGPVIALRADMDALPVTERTPVAFASKVTTIYNGNTTGVMHACGHDAHTAMLMGVAEILAGMRKDLRGTVKFIFQPAEEGAPQGEEGGAKLMVQEGVMENPEVDVVFGLHVSADQPVGTIGYRPAGSMASACDLKIIVKGKGAHGASPWMGTDPVVIGAQIVSSLQTIVSRNLNLTQNPAIVTIGSFHAGNRYNIISETAEMMGTVRTFTAADKKMIFERIRTIATKTAEAGGATAEVLLPFTTDYPVTFNDTALTAKMLPSLVRSAGGGKVLLSDPKTGSEDFSFYQEKAPGLFFFLGAMPAGKGPTSHHTADFFLDETGFKLGVKTMTTLVLDYMSFAAAKK